MDEHNQFFCTQIQGDKFVVLEDGLVKPKEFWEGYRYTNNLNFGGKYYVLMPYDKVMELADCMTDGKIPNFTGEDFSKESILLYFD